MSFLSKLFGSKGGEGDSEGLYFYVQCDRCGEKLRIRADRRHDLTRDPEQGGYVWNKEIMDGRCFQLMYAHVVLDQSFAVQSQSIEGEGHFISQEEYEAEAE
jgi:hypothetical protein